MFCKFCGNQLRDDAKFCPSCGNTVVRQDQYAAAPNAGADQYQQNAYTNTQYQQNTYADPQYQQTTYADAQYPVYNNTQQYQAPLTEEEVSSKQSAILTFGILALAFAVSFTLSFMGIVFGAIAANKVKEYISLVGEPTGRAAAGRGLGKAGLIVGIILTAVFVLYVTIFAIIAANNPYDFYSFYYHFF